METWAKEEDCILLLAGTQSGKTVTGPPWLLREIQRVGPCDYIVASPTYTLLAKNALPKMIAACKGMGRFTASPVPKFEFDSVGKALLFGDPNAGPTVIYFIHASNSDALESLTAGAAWLDECGQKAFLQTSFEAIDRRLAIKRGRKLLTTTPYQFNYVKYEIHDRAAMDPSIAVVNFDSISNPAFPRERYERAQATLPKWKFEMMYRGKFTRPAGMVFENFDEDRHLIDPFEIPDDWVRAQGTDFGEVNTAGVFAARDPGKNRWVIFEDYHNGRIPVSEHVVAFRQKLGYKHGKGKDPWCWGGAPSEDDWREQYALEGYAILRPPVVDRFVGYQMANSMFANDEVVIFRTLERVIKQIRDLTYEIGETGEPNPAKVENEKEFHLAAGFRYLATGIGEGDMKPVVIGAGRRDQAWDEKREIARRLLDEEDFQKFDAAEKERPTVVTPPRVRTVSKPVVRKW